MHVQSHVRRLRETWARKSPMYHRDRASLCLHSTPIAAAACPPACTNERAASQRRRGDRMKGRRVDAKCPGGNEQRKRQRARLFLFWAFPSSCLVVCPTCLTSRPRTTSTHLP
eukprot:6198122-Pleurochrysis_carterae.AAC.1